MIRIVDKTLIITTKKTPVTGDWMCTLQSGFIIRSTNEVIVPRKRFISEHKGDVVSRLNAICKGTEKIIFKFSFKKSS